MTAFIRNHGTTESAASGTTVAVPLAAAVPPGRTLIAAVAVLSPTGYEVTGLSKPGGESASWVKVGSTLAIDSAGTSWVATAFWAIKTTVTWSAAYSTVATAGGTTSARTLALSEWDGLSVTVASLDDNSTNELAPATAISVATDTGLVPGDLVLQAGTVQTLGATGTRCITTSAGGTAAATSQSLGGSSRPGYLYEFVPTSYVITGPGDRSAAYQAQSAGGTPTAVPRSALIVGLRSGDYPPNVPVLTSMASGSSIDRSRTNRLGWTFSSPNFVDSQSARDIHYRLVGDTAWTLISGTSTATFYDFVGGSFAAGNYEVQVQVYGALGQPSGWSPSGFFTAADPVDGPTITYPVDGQTLDQAEQVVWSVPAQDAYQLRRVADVGGDPDPSTVYFDTGTVAEPTTRTLLVAFPVNNRAEHVQLRVEKSGLWSDWDDVGGNVSYTAPPVPARSLHPDVANGSLLVVIANPDPTGDDPAAVSNEVWVDDGKGPERRAVGVSTNGSWLYETPVSGRDYGIPGRLWIVAVAANGITSNSVEAA